MSEITIRAADLGSATALALISALNAELSSRYPEEGAAWTSTRSRRGVERS